MNEHATFRRMTKADLKELVAMENEAFCRYDPDFGVATVHPDAWTAKDISEVAFEEEYTRGWVIEEGNGNIVAYYIYELEDEAYRIRRLLVHSDYRCSDFGRNILWALSEKICKSEHRKTLVGWVSERDVMTCEWMAHMGFASKLIKQGWDNDTDAVEFTYTTTEYVDRETGERYERSQEEREL